MAGLYDVSSVSGLVQGNVTTSRNSHVHLCKSGSLNLLEPAGPVQAFNGIALPWICFHIPYNLLRTQIVEY